MEIKVLAFGQLTDYTGQPEIILTDISTSDELNLKLEELYKGITSVNYAIAVNTELVKQNTQLKNGDTVALLPPFSGG